MRRDGMGENGGGKDETFILCKSKFKKVISCYLGVKT